MKNCIKRVKLSSGFAVMVFVFAGSVFTARYLRLNKGTCRPSYLPIYTSTTCALKVNAENHSKSNKAQQKFSVIHGKLIVFIKH